MENKYQKLGEKFKGIKKYLFEESKLRYPSVYSLQRAAEEIMLLLKVSEIGDEEFNLWSRRKIRFLDIFIADLTGELEHDCEKRNKRYNHKWRVQERKLNEMLSEFETEFHEKLILGKE